MQPLDKHLGNHMEKQDILRMAREVGFLFSSGPMSGDVHPSNEGLLTKLEDFAALVAAAAKAEEREACVSSEVMAFLRGEAPLDGVWFGEPHPTERGAFWWRKHLPRQTVSLMLRVYTLAPMFTRCVF